MINTASGFTVSPLFCDLNANAKILIIDDEPYVLSVLQSLLGQQCRCQVAGSAEEALGELCQQDFDLILSDICMPGMSGLDLLEHIRRMMPDAVVVLISGNLNIESAIEGMRRGAFDYITKPFALTDVETAVQRALRHQAVVKANRNYELHLEEMVSLRTSELRAVNEQLNQAVEKLYLNYRATLSALAMALEARDVETRGHSERVVAYCLRLGCALGLNGHELLSLEHGALLHDIGKIGVRDSILLKEGPLTEEEWELMRRHVEYGPRILRDIRFLKDAARIVAEHHEQWDGSGYPRGLRGEEICLGARIFAVADAVDAITSDRPYRPAQPFEAACEELRRCAGKQFDPRVVEAFLAIPLEEWREIRAVAQDPGHRYNNPEAGREFRDSALAFAREDSLADRILINETTY